MGRGLMASPPRLPAKKDVALALLEQSTVFVHLDPRRDEVRVPPWFKKEHQLVLQIGLNMAIPIRDLDVGEDALSCTLSFQRSPHFCRIPWAAVFALVGENGRGMVWPDDVPPEVAAQAARQQAKEKPKLQAVADEQPSRGAAPLEVAKGPKPRKPRKPRAPKGATAQQGEPAAPSAPAVERKRRARPVPALAAESTEAPKAAQPAAPRVSGAAPGSKRELPPYLRVIK
jgi:stringent starvation protein B